MTVPEMHLPPDLVEFLQAGRQLDYNADDCDAGKITLLPFDDLKLERFPVDGERTADDEGTCYLVLGVNLIATAEEYEPAGMLVWLPIERRFAAWDSDHFVMQVFGETVTWASITADPGPHLDASCGGEGYDPPFEPLDASLAHPLAGPGDDHIGPQPA